MISKKKNKKNQILLIGPTSEIAKNFLNKVDNDYIVISVSRKKFKHINVKKNIILDAENNLCFDKLKKIFYNYKFSIIISFIADQNISKSPIYNVDNEKISKIMSVNAIFPIKLISFLIDYHQLKNNCKIIFFSSRSGSITERGQRKHHLPQGNHIYRASKSLLNSFIKNLAFQNLNKKIIIAYDPGWVQTKTSGGGNISAGEAAENLIKLLKKINGSYNGKFISNKFTKILW